MLERNKYSMRNITNEKVTEYIEQRYIPIDQKLWRMRLDAEDKYIPIIQRDVETLMISILNILKPKNILEVGTAIGYSSVVMAKTVDDSKIITMERAPEMIEKAVETLKDFQVEDRVKILVGDARENMDLLREKCLKGEQEKFDFVFIDGAKSHYLEFWHKLKDQVKPGAIIFCDNALMRGMTVDNSYDIRDKHRTNIKNMREFLDYITGLKDVQTSILPVGDGVTISYIKE